MNLLYEELFQQVSYALSHDQQEDFHRRSKDTLLSRSSRGL